MGMFDTYKPAKGHKCPVCDEELLEWQGKDGPCALFVWSEGVPGAFHQEAGSMNIPKTEWEKEKLPDTFEIYSYDCSCPGPVEAICESKNGVWVSTKINNSSSTKPKQSERM